MDVILGRLSSATSVAFWHHDWSCTATFPNRRDCHSHRSEPITLILRLHAALVNCPSHGGGSIHRDAEFISFPETSLARFASMKGQFANPGFSPQRTFSRVSLGFMAKQHTHHVHCVFACVKRTRVFPNAAGQGTRSHRNLFPRFFLSFIPTIHECINRRT